MADQIASFLFDHAIVLFPAVLMLCLLAAVVVVRRWPKGLLKRIAASMLVLFATVMAVFASGSPYAERNIRSIIRHRVESVRLHPMNGSTVTRVSDLRGKTVVGEFLGNLVSSVPRRNS